MPNVERIVSNIPKKPSSRIPECANNGAVILESLHAHGILKEINETLQVQRQGGYTGLDIFLFFIFFFSSRFFEGIKEFGELTHNYRHQLAAIGGRKRLERRWLLILP